MIETVPDAPVAADVPMPAAVREKFRAFRRRLNGRTLTVWGEHCSECAYPTCYAHCDFYTPRSDLHCRRFAAGVQPVAGEDDVHWVVYRKWGKLEGRGPTRFRPIAAAHARARLDAVASRVAGADVTPFALKRSLAARWNAYKSRPQPDVLPPDAVFVLEHWSPKPGRDFTLTILNAPDASRRGEKALFQHRFSPGSDYGVVTIDAQAIADRVDLSRPYLIQIEPVGEAAGAELVFGVCDFVTTSAPAAAEAQGAVSSLAVTPSAAKVVVWDLDDTLWSGVLVEDGPAKVSLKPEAEAAVRWLDERGVLQTIASKNDEGPALAALERHGLRDFFLHPKINWGPKSLSIRAQALEFNLGLDSFVFIDDQAFERAEVQTALPQVRVLEAHRVSEIAAHPWFALPVTAESRRRRSLYKEEEARTVALAQAGSDYVDFLRSSQLVLEIASASAADVDRIYELSQRTNQLNFTGRKYRREEVVELLAADRLALVLRCQDRFGDYGMIGFVEFDPVRGVVEELFMSCRVQRKRVEHALIGWLTAGLRSSGLDRLYITYRPTGRNAAARDMLDGLSFAPPSGDGEGGDWRSSSAAPIEDADVVKVIAVVERPRIHA